MLALQGDFAAHAAAFRELGQVREVRRVAELDGLAGLMIPGGESTTLLNLMRDEPWFEALRRFHDSGGVLAGTCAGAILLAREVRPRQASLGLLDAVIERNAYGRQVDSFEAASTPPALGGAVDAVFIRAPRFRALFPDVEVLARLGRAGAGAPGPSRRRHVPPGADPGPRRSTATWPSSPARRRGPAAFALGRRAVFLEAHPPPNP